MRVDVGDVSDVADAVTCGGDEEASVVRNGRRWGWCVGSRDQRRSKGDQRRRRGLPVANCKRPRPSKTVAIRYTVS